jgi:hypothetical protein
MGCGIETYVWFPHDYDTVVDILEGAASQ